MYEKLKRRAFAAVAFVALAATGTSGFFSEPALSAPKDDLYTYDACLTARIANEVAAHLVRDQEAGFKLLEEYKGYQMCFTNTVERGKYRRVRPSFYLFSAETPEGNLVWVEQVVITDPFVAPRQAIFVVWVDLAAGGDEPPRERDA